MKRSRVVVLGLGLTLIAPFAPQIPGCVAAHSAKTGRVVDIETGMGVPNATVIASARFLSEGFLFGPSGNEVLYSKTAETRADGSYYVPPTWTDMKSGLPGTRARIKWFVTVFEPGYVVKGDEQSWQHYRDDGTRIYASMSTARPPKFSNILAMEIEDLKMYKIELGLKDAANYYGNIASMGMTPVPFPEFDKDRMRLEGNLYFKEKVCAMDPSEYVGASTLFGIIDFVLDRPIWSRMIKATYKKSSANPYDMKAIQLGEICNALRLEAKPQ